MESYKYDETSELVKVRRVILFTDDYLPRESTLAKAVAKMRLELKSVGIDVYVVCPNYGPMEPNQSVIRVPIERSLENEISLAPIAKQHQRTIETICQTVRPDVVHIMTPGPIGRLAEKMFRSGHIPIVFSSELDYDELINWKFLKNRWIREIVRFGFWWHFKNRFLQKSKFILCSDPLLIGKLEARGIQPIVNWSIGEEEFSYEVARRSISKPLQELLKIYTICVMHNA